MDLDGSVRGFSLSNGRCRWYGGACGDKRCKGIKYILYKHVTSWGHVKTVRSTCYSFMKEETPRMN